MKKGHVFFITGLTGAGKNTVINGLTQQDIGLEFVLSCKTRDFREGEKEGINYRKLSVDEFKEMIENEEFLEYNFVHNQNYYGTRKKDVYENGIDAGKFILKEIDMLILPTLIETISKSKRRKDFSIIVLDLPIEEVKNRMIARGDDIEGEDYKNRLESAQKEKKLTHLGDYVIDATKSKEQVLSCVQTIVEEKIADVQTDYSK